MGTIRAKTEDVSCDIKMLGPLDVRQQGSPVSFRTRKTAGVFAYLVFYGGRRVSKLVLIDAFWPEVPPEKGRQSLRMALSSIRDALPWFDSAIEADRDSILTRLDEVSVDAHVFMERAKSNNVDDLIEATQLYDGRFLTGMTEDWISAQELEFEEIYAKTVVRLTDTALSVGRIQESINAAQRAFQQLGPREDVAVALMKCYSAAGHSARAIEVFAALEQHLMNEWGESPGPAAAAALDAVPRSTVAVPLVATNDLHPSGCDRLEPIYGRTDEIREILQLINHAEGPRCVCVTGLGGTGKTALAHAVASRLRSEGKTILMVELADADSPSQVVDRVLHAAGAVDQSLVEWVRSVPSRGTVVVLDNAEHLISGVRDVAQALVASASDVRILLTSRIPTGIPDERLFPLGPLPLPESWRDLGGLRASPWVQILIDAAQRVRPGFGVTAGNAESIHKLCRRLDGLPLAAQLAAARLGTWSPAEILASIGRARDLASSHDAFAPRHRDLAAIVEWSVAQLNEDERRSFVALCVCRGGFTRSLAHAIVGEDAEAQLLALGRTGLLRWVETDDQLRFEMLESVR